MSDIEFNGVIETIKPEAKIIPFEDEDLKHRVRLRGDKPDEDFAIFITEEVLRDIVDYSKTQLTREIGGVLVGGYYTHEGREFITIEAYIKASKAISHAASLTFTHEALHEVNNIKTDKYDDFFIVGWHHTHPNYGVFLSSYDMFIQKNFWNLPWQVALVVDPCRETIGFLRWKRNRMETTGFYYIKTK